jgi:ATP-dependent DNA helicase 2 subunit 2
MALSESCCIIGQKGNERAQIALSSLIHSLDETDRFALARLVTKDDKPPVMIMMAPLFEPDFECLIDVQVYLLRLLVYI